MTSAKQPTPRGPPCSIGCGCWRATMPTEEQLQEIHRLAVLGDVAAIAQDVGPRLTGRWLATSRFREVREVSRQTLALGPHARTLVDLARAQHRLGEVAEALDHYRTALSLYTEV